MRQWAWLAIGLACVAGAAHGADEKALHKLEGPTPTTLKPLDADAPTQPVKFVRLVMKLKPEPWAEVTRHREADQGGWSEELLTWKDGQLDIKPSTVSGIITEELTAAHVPTEGQSSLFDAESKANLLLGVRIDGLEGRFCLSCGRIGLDGRWRGAVVMDARWEIYSSIERKVLATINTHGGFTSKQGLEGDPERLIYEALRDNLRVLIGSDDFRRIVTTAPVGGPAAVAAPAGKISLLAGAKHLSAAQASMAVAVVFATDGSGSGFLVSTDGYLITNHHVVGASKYVKLKWPDGSETIGEVIRSDRRRDVALVKTDVHGRPPLDLRLGAAQQGETVFAIGSPLGDRFQNSMTKGIVSAIRTEGGLNYIQSDVMVNHGSSGGPLLDEKGRVIGLTVSGQAPNGDPIGLNFFIPIDDALKALSLTAAG